MTYYLVQFDDGTQGYQEVSGGNVTRYCDVDGNTMFTVPPLGLGCRVIDAAPPRLPWML